MPVELARPDRSKAPLVLYDTRSHQLDEETRVGQNGFVSATIKGDVLTLDYRDIDDISLLVEAFSPNADGTLKHQFQDPGVLRPPP